MPLLWISLAFITGVVCSLFISIQWPVPVVVGGFCLAMTFFENRLFFKHSRYARLRKTLITPLCLLITAFCVGLVRGEAGKPLFTDTDLAYYNSNQPVVIIALASQPVENHDKSTLLTVSAREISLDGSNFIPVKGEALILLPAGRSYLYGDLMQITGSLETPPERADFSYKQYLENRGVFSYLSYPKIKVTGSNQGSPVLTAIYSLRDRIASACEQTVPQPEAAFLSGMLVGRDEDIPDNLKQAFQNTGTSHLVAISGFNITILSVLILALTNRLLPRGWSVLAAVILLWAYAVMAGASPSVIRAAIMGCLAMIGRSIGRTRAAINSLGLAAGIMVADNTLILRDIGFQLSVAATAGILLIGAPMNDHFIAHMTAPGKPSELNWMWRNLGDLVIITLSAQVFTLPFLLYHFQTYPLIGMLVNPLVLPVQPAAMLLGGAAALAGMVFLPLGKILGMVAWIPLAYTTRVVELFSSYHNIGLINLHLDLWQSAVFLSSLVIAIVVGRKWLKWWKPGIVAASFIGLFMVLVLMVNAIAQFPDGKLYVMVFRQGKDLSNLILAPGGQRILITNRPGDKDLSAFVDRRLPLMDRRLNALILPNPSAGTSIGLADTLSHYRPEWRLANGFAGGNRVQSQLASAALEVDMQIQDAVPLTRFDLGAGAIFAITQVNERGSLFSISFGANRVDLQYGTSSDIGSSGLFSTVMPDVLIHDHLDESPKSGQAGIVLTADMISNGSQGIAMVPDGGWLVIIMDGTTIQILEKANAAH